MRQPTLARQSSVLLLMFVTLSLTASSALAQPNLDRMKARYTERVDGAMKALALEGQQADTVKSILQAGADKQIALLGEMSGDRRAMREKMGAVDKKTEEQLSAVLSEDQMAKYKEFVASQRTRGDRNRQRNGSRGGQR